MYQPQFQITNNLLTYVATIESAKALIDHSPLVPSWEAKFRDEAMTRSIHFGTHIEGNDLTSEQASKIVALKDVSTPQEAAQAAGIIARDRDIQEVINYRNVVSWIDKLPLSKKASSLDLSVLHTLHRLTMQKLLEEPQIGSWRNQQVIVRGARDGQVVFRPPVAVEIPYLIEDFFTWLHADATSMTHPIFKAAIAHYRLAYIHPYIEGNGRVARAFATAVLYAADYDFKRFFSLEEYFDSDVDAYYQALLSVQQSDKADLTYFLEYFTYGLAVEIDKVKQKVMKLSQDLKLQRELGQQVALSERQIILLEIMQNQGRITSEDAQKALPQVSVDTILRDIKDLIEKGVVRKHGVTKGVSYELAS